MARFKGAGLTADVELRPTSELDYRIGRLWGRVTTFYCGLGTYYSPWPNLAPIGSAAACPLGWGGQRRPKKTKLRRKRENRGFDPSGSHLMASEPRIFCRGNSRIFPGWMASDLGWIALATMVGQPLRAAHCVLKISSFVAAV